MPVLAPIAALLLAVQTAAAPPAPVAAAPAVAVRIGVLPGDDNALPYYAEARGTFPRFGLKAGILEPYAGAAAIAAIKQGTIDVGLANVISVVKEIQDGAPVVLLAPATLYDSAHPSSVLMQAPHSNYRTGRDLNGKIVDSPSGAGSLGALGPQLWIDRTGGDSRTVRMVGGIGMAKVADALNAGTIDAAEMTEPQKTIHLLKGDVKLLATSFDAIGAKFIGLVWVASKPWVDAHPAAARRFTEAMLETAHWANAHRAETAAMLQRRLKLPPAVMQAMGRSLYAEKFTPALLQPSLDVGIKYGVLKPVTAAEVIPKG